MGRHTRTGGKERQPIERRAVTSSFPPWTGHQLTLSPMASPSTVMTPPRHSAARPHPPTQLGPRHTPPSPLIPHHRAMGDPGVIPSMSDYQSPARDYYSALENVCRASGSGSYYRAWRESIGEKAAEQDWSR